MIAKVYSCLGPLYVKIAEEKVNDDNIDDVLEKWKYACLVEVFDDEEKQLLLAKCNECA